MNTRKSIRDMMPEEVLNLPKLGLDDTFEFTCRACGKCCKNREDILLTPYDLYRIAGYFGRKPHEIIERYCEVYEGGSSHFPVVRVVPVPPNNSCPFLWNRRCSVHDKKPAVCRVYPLARIFTDSGESQYYFNGAGCNHEPAPHTVRDWIADISTEESEKAGQLWRDVIMTLHPLIQPENLNISKSKREKIMTMLFGGLWLAYDMDKPFVSQLEATFLEIKSALEKFPQ